METRDGRKFKHLLTVNRKAAKATSPTTLGHLYRRETLNLKFSMLGRRLDRSLAASPAPLGRSNARPFTTGKTCRRRFLSLHRRTMAVGVIELAFRALALC